MNVSVSQVSLVARLAQDLTFRDVPASQARQFGVGVCKDILVALLVGLSGWQVSRLDLSACLLSHSLSNLRELRQLWPLGTFDQTHTADFPVCPSLALLGAHTLKVFNKSSRGAIVCRADRFEEGPSKILGSSSRLGIGENQFYEKKKRKIESVLVVLGFPSCKMVVRLRQYVPDWRNGRSTIRNFLRMKVLLLHYNKR